MTKGRRKKLKLLVASIGLVIITSLLLFTKPDSSVSLNTPTSSPTSVEPINNPILINLLKNLGDYGFNLTEADSMWWVSDDNWSILVNDAGSIGVVKSDAYSELQNSDSDTTEIIEIIDAFFKNRGFILNSKNTSKSINDKTFYDYIQGYQNDKDLCLLTVNPDNGSHQAKSGGVIKYPNIVVTCTSKENFTSSYNEQLEFLKVLNRRNVTISIASNNGEAARVDVKYRASSGHYALLTKINNIWKVIYEGQDIPTCSTLKKYTFPKDIFYLCSE